MKRLEAKETEILKKQMVSELKTLKRTNQWHPEALTEVNEI